MVTVNQITPIPISSLPAATAITGNEATAIVQGGATVQAPISQYPQGISAGVVVFGDTGGSPFPNYRTLKAGTNVNISDGGAQGDLTLSVTPGTGTGSVIDVSVVAANGISGSVANSSTTPAITISLGDITPSSVAASGAISGSNLSGTNTGNQTIALTGDVTGSGTGTFAATLATVNSNVGSFTNASVTVNGKGLVTAASSGAAPVTSVSGTASRVTSSGGATPTIDISASYVGQSSITTLGTVSTGVWNGSVIPSSKGGTGVANNVASTFAISGNFPTTITVSGTTAVTMPTSGTIVNSVVTSLSSLSTVGTITSGIWNAGSVTSSGAVTSTAYTPTSSSVPTTGIYLVAANKVGIATNSALGLQVTYETGTGTPVNYVNIATTGTGFLPYVEVAGSDTSVSFKHCTQASGSHVFNTNGPVNSFADVTQFAITHTASATNYIIATGANANNPSLTTSGSDLTLKSATGFIQFGSSGSFTANGTVATTMTSLGPTGSRTTVQKWLTIKDSGGSTFYIPCY